MTSISILPITNSKGLEQYRAIARFNNKAYWYRSKKSKA